MKSPQTQHRRFIYLALVLTLLGLSNSLLAEAGKQQVIIEDSYVDLHTGPGRGYPITYSVEQGQTVTIQGQRTGWVKVNTHRDVSGWARATDLLPLSTNSATFYNSWQVGLGLGDFEGARATSLIAGYRLSEHFTMEVFLTEALGDFSDSQIARVQLNHQFLPSKRWSPFFGLGAGVVKNSTDATLIKTQESTNNLLTVSFGARYRIDGRYRISLECNNHTILTSNSNNEEKTEWTFGINAFF